VASRDKDVDPVGACVGMKGMRVQSIIRELRGEKIDIIPYNEETVAARRRDSGHKSCAACHGLFVVWNDCRSSRRAIRE